MDLEGCVNELHRAITGFDNYSRDVTVVAHISNAIPLDLTSDEIISFNYAADVFAEGDGPVGQVASNELTMELLGQYTVQIQDEIAVTLTEEISGVSCLLCTLKVYDCVYDVSTDITTITAYDILYDILSDTPNYGKVVENLSLYDILLLIFKNQGIPVELLDIDVTLKSYVLPYFFMQKGALVNTLNYLCEAYRFGIYVTAEGKIRAATFKNSIAEASLSEDVHLLSTTTAPASIRPTTTYDVTYSTYVSSPDVLVVDTKVTAKAGSVRLENINIEQPLLSLTCVQIISDASVELVSLKHDQYTVSLDLVVATDTELRIVITGDIIDTSVVQKLHSATKATIIENPYIVTKEQALSVHDMYAAFSNSGAVLTCAARMNPEIPVNTVAEVKDHTIQGAYRIISSTYNYDGSLDGQYTLYSQEVYNHDLQQ